ncbi:carboxylesterase/lipase family protein [Alicyclobacillus ferrooxydans]|uniref:Carboxylic ester hydrolase n=1 Tax=Alicyclobacillus ferrooxydans TaxID=471514 RepID=A0A0P9C6X8_9BACL|nr:carboxylesterase/lipase family protein [Alicyclobacillus ferrooxydans]KPV40903.1 hypothetical protein AN477_20775 [Alicyclobacillus ferrooxydans]
MSLIIQTSCGKVQGTFEGSVAVWKGIPFAKAPVGKLRFQAPQPREPWEGVFDATEFGPACVQGPNAMNPKEKLPQSEDCLNLNIWSPGADDKKRPVMVWIHGGSFVFGSGRTPWYNGRSFAEQGDVVVVTINYRLGPLGFLYLGDLVQQHPEFGEEYAVSGNCALLDQISALQWVHDNIAAFGGDPDCVTVFGESAGSMSVGSLLVAPAARGLFQQAIMESGAPSMKRIDTAVETRNRLLEALGLGSNDAAQLFELPAEQLVAASDKIAQGTRLTWSPVMDGTVITKPFATALESGASKGIPLLIGCNLNELTLWTARDPMWRQAQDDTALMQMFERRWGKIPPELASFYFNGKSGTELLDALTQLGSYSVFGAPIQKIANRRVGDSPLYVYRFDWQSTAAKGVLKACHALEIPFVFNTIDDPSSQVFTGDSADRAAVAMQMHHAWIAFAHTGNPNTGELPQWPAYNLDSRPTMIFDVESRVVNDPYGEERIVWEQVIGQ